MQYRVHDVPKELWAFIKARSYIEGVSINQYLINLLQCHKTRFDSHNKWKDRNYIDVKKPFKY